MPEPPTLTVFTIAARNYAAHARVLMASVARHLPEAHRVVVEVDGPWSQRLVDVEHLDALTLSADLDLASLYYDALEFSTAIKPHAFSALLGRGGTTIYLDPDFELLARPSAMLDALVGADLVLTPHLLRPLWSAGRPTDLDILRSGAFNFGFCAMRSAPETQALCAWWAERCRFDCRVDPDAGVFTDQRWMDLAPGFVSRTVLLRDVGFNLAYWNLDGRAITRDSHGWSADGQPISGFHFSGFRPAQPGRLSRHETRFEHLDGALAELTANYAEALKAAGVGKAQKQNYARGLWDLDERVRGVLRPRLRAAVQSGQITTVDQVAAWLAAPAPWANDIEVSHRLTGIALAEGFDLENESSRTQALEWLRKHPDWQAPQALRVPYAGSDNATVLPERGSHADVLAALSTQGPMGGPAACDSLWQARPDLRARADRGSSRLVAICLGSEAKASRFPAPLVSTWAASVEPSTRLGIALDAARLASPPNAVLHRPAALAAWALWTLAEPLRWPSPFRHALQAELDRLGSVNRRWGVSVIVSAIWSEREDLQRTFDLGSLIDRLRLLRWLRGPGAIEYGLDGTQLGHDQLGLLSVLQSPMASPPRQRGFVERCRTLTIRGPGATNALAIDALEEATLPTACDIVELEMDPRLAMAALLGITARGVRWKSYLSRQSVSP